MDTNETHDPSRKSHVASANAAGTDFPIQNLPYGVFRVRGRNETARVGIAIGDQIFDLSRTPDIFTGEVKQAVSACAMPQLNDLMRLGPEAWSGLRLQVSQLLSADERANRSVVRENLVPMADAEMAVPVKIPNFTDFFASIFHATNAGKMFRPDNPLMPNYKYVPVAYHSRPSSIVVSGTPVRRPKGQTKPANETVPVYRPARNLDYELELGFFIGTASQWGTPIPIAQAREHVFGYCLLNDWSARDIQAWEYQPLGPFLAKNFASSVSPWVVTDEALAPFRTPAFKRPEGDPAPLPHLDAPQDRAEGGLDIRMEALILTEKMRAAGEAPHRLSTGTFADIYWTVAQMVAHHTSSGCNLETGDLFGSGTVSGAPKDSWASLLELTLGGREKLTLPNGEIRGFIEDGDEIVFRGYCERDGFARIGFGECHAVILPAQS
ncbi:MAG TPA: fumarylacetoacetase [Xanthobacteraceae bacterium]|nr:fumarylacetoacetase [Xanthobacteraceae bacterium]